MKQDKLFKILGEANPVVLQYFGKYDGKSKMQEYIKQIRQYAIEEFRSGLLERLKTEINGPGARMVGDAGLGYSYAINDVKSYNLPTK